MLQRRFSAARPNEKWLADITDIPTREGWLYLAAVLVDAHSRRIIGWAMDRDLTQELVLQALRMALRHRHPPRPLLHHSDRGSQYTAEAYQQLLKAYASSSMSRCGTIASDATPRPAISARWPLNRPNHSASSVYESGSSPCS